jgi:hypothetical protein
MPPTLRRNRVLAIVLLLLAVAVTALAVVQYRWIDRTTEAERRTRLGAAELVARRVADGFRRELQDAFQAFAWPDHKAVLYDEWTREARWPSLVSAVYVAHQEEYSETWSLFRVDRRQQTLVPAEWTPQIAPSAAAGAIRSGDLSRAAAAARSLPSAARGSGHRRARPGDDPRLDLPHAPPQRGLDGRRAAVRRQPRLARPRALELDR